VIHRGAYAYVSPVFDPEGRNAELDALKGQLTANYGPDGQFAARRVNDDGVFDEFGGTINWTYEVVDPVEEGA
jgi:hypothetical protein